MYTYKTQGTCSKAIHLEIKDGVIEHLEFDCGCDGNLIGLSRLIVGQRAEEVLPKLKGIQCRNGTSCPDQLAKALEKYLEKGE